ncbi:unnamed protein product, partial [Ectocarpus fasciculatus]
GLLGGKLEDPHGDNAKVYSGVSPSEPDFAHVRFARQEDPQPELRQRRHSGPVQHAPGVRGDRDPEEPTPPAIPRAEPAKQRQRVWPSGKRLSPREARGLELNQRPRESPAGGKALHGYPLP